MVTGLILLGVALACIALPSWRAVARSRSPNIERSGPDSAPDFESEFESQFEFSFALVLEAIDSALADPARGGSGACTQGAPAPSALRRDRR